MATRTLKRTLIIALMFVVLAISIAPQVHIYRFNDESTFVSVCSDSANLEIIAAYIARQHAELGDNDGYDLTQPGLQCLLYNK